jgi:meso-butanediol dehydrogenase/(S,S)-butanediol dehydrogenase/diacetyl reductase
MWNAELFAGKVVAVSGAASGIGAAITRRFLEAGATVAAGDIQTSFFARLQEEFGKDLTRRLVPLTLDVSNPHLVDDFTTPESPRWDP